MISPEPTSDFDVLSHLDANTASAMHDRTAESLYVIVNKARTSVIKDPALHKPWSNRNKKVAEDMARHIGHGCFVATLKDAMHLVIAGLQKAQLAPKTKL